jgi:hypothetical protein
MNKGESSVKYRVILSFSGLLNFAQNSFILINWFNQRSFALKQEKNSGNISRVLSSIKCKTITFSRRQNTASH